MKTSIDINSGLSSFLMLDRILDMSDSRIVGMRFFGDGRPYVMLESLAQLGAIHVRRLTDFSKHVFLMKIIGCFIPIKTKMDGECLLSGDVAGRSSSSFRYFLKAEKDGVTMAKAELLYAAIEYDRNFKKGILHDHYVRVFSCLQRNSETG
ncbi:MAG TPA: hypothetical protein VLZ07_11615 [Syntrophales bacterium]|nr:hypothetical protein [Syntrophales bacterium]